MKGIVLDRKGHDVAVLLENGEVRRIRNQNYQIGEEINIRSGYSSLHIKWVAVVAAALLVFTSGVFAYTTPTGYVSLDFSPSIEYSINMFERVLEARPLDYAGEEVLEDLNLRHKSIEYAIEATTKKCLEEGYITEEESNIIITTSIKNKSDASRLADQLKEQVETRISDEGKQANIESEAVGKERVDQAKALGVTPGKLKRVEELLETTPALDNQNRDEYMNEWLNKSMNEINKKIRENRKAVDNKSHNKGNENSKADKGKYSNKESKSNNANHNQKGSVEKQNTKKD